MFRTSVFFKKNVSYKAFFTKSAFIPPLKWWAFPHLSSVKIDGTETKAYTSGGRGIEALFAEWIVKSLKKGGTANIILPDGFFTNIGNNRLKQLILETCYIDSIISLPVGTFFNTPKKTFILTIHKRTEDEINGPQPYPVYAYLCSSIGETMDIHRFDTDENDLNDSVDLYNLYRGNRENKIAITAVNSNPRAKLLPIDRFGADNNWNIELFWSDEEKIKLGIKKKDTIMSVSEFHGYVSDLIDDMKSELANIPAAIPEDGGIKWAYPLITDLFHPQCGNYDYTKAWIAENRGDIPLYSGTTDGECARINTADYSGEYLTWSIDGLAGFIMYHNEKFSITGHRGILIPTDKCANVDLRYIKYVLEPIFRKRKKGREGECGKNEYTSLKPIAIKRMADTIPIPVSEDGKYDFQKQKELADQYEQIEEIRKGITQKMSALSEITVLQT